jgi:hypothetical protein
MVIITLVGLLALFSLVSIVLSGEGKNNRRPDPRDDISLWIAYAFR